MCPGSNTNLLCDFRQVTEPLWALAFFIYLKNKGLKLDDFESLFKFNSVEFRWMYWIFTVSWALNKDVVLGLEEHII